MVRRRNAMELLLSEHDKSYYLATARASIAESLGIIYENDVLKKETPSYADERFGVFVTLNEKEDLRGCIGYIKGVDKLLPSIRHMAKQAAFHDPRFPPVKKGEFDRLHIEISVLSPMEPLPDIGDIVIGRDGLFLMKGFYSGLLLPQVPVEYGWDSITFLEHLSMKAGLERNAYKSPDAVIYRFTAYIFSE